MEHIIGTVRTRSGRKIALIYRGAGQEIFAKSLDPLEGEEKVQGIGFSALSEQEAIEGLKDIYFSPYCEFESLIKCNKVYFVKTKLYTKSIKKYTFKTKTAAELFIAEMIRMKEFVDIEIYSVGCEIINEWKEKK